MIEIVCVRILFSEQHKPHLQILFQYQDGFNLRNVYICKHKKLKLNLHTNPTSLLVLLIYNANLSSD